MVVSSLHYQMERTHRIVLPQTKGGRRWWRGDGDLRVVLPVGTEVGDVPSRWVPGKDKQSREAQRKLHVSELEV